MYKFFQSHFFSGILILLLSGASLPCAWGHPLSEGSLLPLRSWTLAGGETLHASFMLARNDTVLLEQAGHAMRRIPFASLSDADRRYVQERQAAIRHLNRPFDAGRVADAGWLRAGFMGAVLLAVSILAYVFRRRKYAFRYAAYLVAATVLSALYGFTLRGYLPVPFGGSTNPLTIDSAFVPFKPNVYTRWDATYFYVESRGIPTTHLMMTGITSWQQQVPIPQCYTGNNPWSIPLNPVLAAKPVPVNPAHFSRGAIAIAVNGVPIFNPYTNTGVDAFLDGQLDQWGGHSGRADDYHYHIAPLHLYSKTAATLPIAYAFDGFPVYGAIEPSGIPMMPLDTNHGHFGANGVYHYHGSAAAPYMIAYLVGVVTEDSTHQLIPQAQARPVRPSTTPLRGATITNFALNGPNGYILTYTLTGQTYQVSYSWTNNGVYTYNFINPGGTTTSTYNGFVPCQLPTAVFEPAERALPLGLFPNPAQGSFSVRLPSGISAAEVRSLHVFASDGRAAFRSDTYREQISTAGMAPGLYYVLMQTADNLYGGRIVVE